MKLQVGSGESIQLQDHVNLEGISRVVREKYGWNNAFTLVYRDEENEWITIGSEAELLAAKQTVAPAPLEIRVLAKPSFGNAENELVEVNLGTSNNSEIIPTTRNTAATVANHGESDVGESDFEFVEGEEDYISNLTTSAAAASAAPPGGIPSEATYSIPSQGSVELFHEELQPLAAIVSQQLLDQENPYATSHCAPMQPPTFTAEPSFPTPAPVVDTEIADLLLPSEAPVMEVPPSQTPSQGAAEAADAAEAPKQAEPSAREDVVTEIAEQVIREAAAQHFSLLAENLEKILQQADETVPPLCEALARVFAKPETGRNVQVALQDPAIVSALVALSEEYLARQEQGNFWQALSPLVLQLLNLLTKLVTQSPELFSLIPSASAAAVRHVAALKACAGGEASAAASTNSATTAASASCETNEDMEVVHKRVQCNGCLELDPKLTDYVRGPRFKSAVVEDFDLCLKCEQSGKYRDSHGPFLKIYKPSQAPEAILCVLPAAHRGNGGAAPTQEQAPQRVLEQFWDEVKGSDAMKGNTFVSAENVPRCAALDPKIMKSLVEAHAEGAAAAASASGIPAPPVVASVEAAVLNVTSTNGCPGRHMLRRFVVPNPGYVCDRCNATAGDYAVMHGCRTCNFDLCDACVNGKSAGGVAASVAAPASGEISTKPQAKFVTDVSLPDGSVVAPSASLSKTWRLRNNGTVRWPQGSRIVHVGGDSIGLPAGGVLVDAVEPGHVVDLTVPLIAPARPGRVVGYFRLMTPDQKRFGNRFWVDLTVDGTIGQQLAATVAAPFFEMGKSIVSRVQEALVPGLPAASAAATTTPVEVVPPPPVDAAAATPSYPKVEPPPVDPRLETYAIELTTLSEMGFLDFEKNCDYLSDANGDLETVITRLMAEAAP